MWVWRAMEAIGGRETGVDTAVPVDVPLSVRLETEPGSVLLESLSEVSVVRGVRKDAMLAC